MTAKPYLKLVLVGIVFAMFPACNSSAQKPTNQAGEQVSRTTQDKAAIVAVLSAYETSLNASDAEASIQLYADDGIVMPPNNQSVIGKAALRALYQAGSKAFSFHVKFSVAEVVVMAPGWAFARTNSAGTMTLQATGVTLPEANQELFIFNKTGVGKWKIARYSFSSTNPAQP